MNEIFVLTTMDGTTRMPFPTILAAFPSREVAHEFILREFDNLVIEQQGYFYKNNDNYHILKVLSIKYVSS